MAQISQMSGDVGNAETWDTKKMLGMRMTPCTKEDMRAGIFAPRFSREP